MRKFTEKINETKNYKYEYGCLMYCLDIPNWKDILQSIDKDDIYIDEDVNKPSGLTHDPHITVLFGFHDKDINLDDIYNDILENKEVAFKVKGISVFESKEYDILKYDIESDDLVNFNKILSEKYPFTTEHAYHPHMTIGYVKKGVLSKYKDILEVNLAPTDKYFKYSRTNGMKIYFKENGD